MTTRIDQILEQRRSELTTQNKDYKVTIWHMMIAFGVCTRPVSNTYSFPVETTQWHHWDMYGAQWYIDLGASQNLLSLLRSGVTIDYDASTDPASMDYVGHEFIGTDQDLGNVNTMWGQLHLHDGSTFSMGLICDRTSISQILDILTLDISLDDALEHLAKRLEQNRVPQELPTIDITSINHY